VIINPLGYLLCGSIPSLQQMSCPYKVTCSWWMTTLAVLFAPSFISSVIW
jgi:hypothetical protein